MVRFFFFKQKTAYDMSISDWSSDVCSADLTSSHRKDEEMNEPIMQFFAFEHLPPHLQTVSQNVHSLAQNIVDNLPRNPERTVALRKLLESKDAAVRARIFKEQP